MTDSTDVRKPGARMPALCVIALLGLLVPIRAVAQPALPTLQPPFDGYTLVNLGVPGVPPGYGGIAFVPGDPNTILIAGRTETVGGLLYTIPVTRDATGSIDGFAGVADVAANTYAISAGVAYGPGGVVFYTRSTNEIGEVKPGSPNTDKVVSLASLSSYYPSGLTFVPPGFAGEGKLKFVGFASGQWWSAGVIPDNQGTFDVFAATRGPTLPGGPEGFTWVLQGSQVFPYQSILVSEFYSKKVSTYYVDANGDPIVDSRREVITNFDAPDGIATDPLTGDFLIANYYGAVVVMRSAPLPPTTSTSTSSSTTSTTSTTRPTTTTTSTRPTTTSSSTTTSTTSTTRPTTSSTTAPPATTSSTTTSTTPTTHPTTTSSTRPSTTTSTILQPTTTSSSTSTTTSSSPTTTTAPTADCEHGTPLDVLACRVDALRDVVHAASELGPFQPTFVAKLETAHEAAAAAEAACGARDRSAARDALARVDRQMITIRARLRTKRARRIVPREVSDAIGAEASGISADVRALRGSLLCL